MRGWREVKLLDTSLKPPSVVAKSVKYVTIWPVTCKRRTRDFVVSVSTRGVCHYFARYLQVLYTSLNFRSVIMKRVVDAEGH